MSIIQTISQILPNPQTLSWRALSGGSKALGNIVLTTITHEAILRLGKASVTLSNWCMHKYSNTPGKKALPPAEMSLEETVELIGKKEAQNGLSLKIELANAYMNELNKEIKARNSFLELLQKQDGYFTFANNQNIEVNDKEGKLLSLEEMNQRLIAFKKLQLVPESTASQGDREKVETHSKAFETEIERRRAFFSDESFLKKTCIPFATEQGLIDLSFEVKEDSVDTLLPMLSEFIKKKNIEKKNLANEIERAEDKNKPDDVEQKKKDQQRTTLFAVGSAVVFFFAGHALKGGVQALVSSSLIGKIESWLPEKANAPMFRGKNGIRNLSDLVLVLGKVGGEGLSLVSAMFLIFHGARIAKGLINSVPIFYDQKWQAGMKKIYSSWLLPSRPSTVDIDTLTSQLKKWGKKSAYEIGVIALAVLAYSIKGGNVANFIPGKWNFTSSTF